MDLGIADHGQSACCKQAAQIAIASPGNVAELLLATARVLLGNQPDPGRKVPSRAESPWIGNAGHECGGECRPDARYLIQPFACLIGAMPSHDAAVEFEDLPLQHPQLRTESGKTLARDLRHTIIVGISHN